MFSSFGVDGRNIGIREVTEESGQGSVAVVLLPLVLPQVEGRLIVSRYKSDTNWSLSEAGSNPHFATRIAIQVAIELSDSSLDLETPNEAI